MTDETTNTDATEVTAILGQLALPEGYKFETKIAGQPVVYDPSKMHPSWLLVFLEKGMQRFANDKHSSEEPSNKLALCKAVAIDSHKGEPFVAYRNAATSRLPNDVSLALKAAKIELTILFKRITTKGKVADFFDHAKTKEFFEAKGDSVVWKTARVITWIEKQKAEGKRDFMAEAKASLSVDLDDIEL